MGLGELPGLAAEIRRALIEKGGFRGGHLASNLGVVELTVALHHVFESPRDRIIFDVSHQCYAHKMLTGRVRAFTDPEHYDDVSGYSNPAESDCDPFTLGHTSTSISLACGLAMARDACGESYDVVAVTGDSALDGGEAFEALNYAGEVGCGMVIVLNDNGMSIPENHGALSEGLRKLRKTRGRVSDNYFRALGLDYRFVGDGHDVSLLVEAFEAAKGADHPILLHVITQKGKGYGPAEANPEGWHWAHPFDEVTGEFKSNVPKVNYGALFCEHMLEVMGRDRSVVLVTPSMPHNVGFNAEARAKVPGQIIDVGIAEQNAATLAVGLAAGGLKPVLETSSTFFQRAYDQIEQEMCIDGVPVTMVVTHGSVFGHSNDTHHGLLDIAMLGNIPGLTYLAPANRQEYFAMLDWSLDYMAGPIAIRVPWMGVYEAAFEVALDYGDAGYQVVREGSRVAVLALGSFYQLGERVADEIWARTGVAPTLVNPRVINGVDEMTLTALAKGHEVVVTLEDGFLSGGFGSRVAQFYGSSPTRVLCYGFSQEVPNRYDPRELMEENGLVPEVIATDIETLLWEFEQQGSVGVGEREGLEGVCNE